MKKLSFFMAVVLSVWTANAQTGAGIRFEKGQRWQQILAKARAENKYIFVDCFATWCGPCKLMDRDVYPRELVGTYMNDRFISVKMQMDSTELDSPEVSMMYADARSMQAQYHVTGYPTYLFFSPEGKVVYKSMGAIRDSAFLRLAGNALDPSKQYYALVDNYLQGRKDYGTMGELAVTVKTMGEDETALTIAKDYKESYLDRATEQELMQKQNLAFIAGFSSLVGSKDRYFDLFYHRGEEVDKAAGRKGFSESFVDFVITSEEIEARLWKGKEPISKKPDWDVIRKTITEKYNAGYADRLLPRRQLSFYKKLGDWRKFAKLVDYKISRQAPVKGKGGSYGSSYGDTWALNGYAWDVFLKCSDKKVLKRALAWSELSIQVDQPSPNVQYLDTKANILYKLGRKEEAIALEEQAFEIDKRMSKKPNGMLGYDGMIAKMKEGQPTWPVK